jgi:hypothetical protein
LEQAAIPEDKDEEIEFRLFAPSKKSDNNVVTKFRVHTPEADNRPPGLVNPERPRSYYFRDSLSPEAEKKIQLAAVSGDDVLARSKTPCPGWSMPWRVTVVTTKGVPISTPDPAIVQEAENVRKRKRKGKKSRIAIRQKLAKDRELMEKARAEAADKALHDKMKKAERNRKKKFKKRARDKLKKLNEDGSPHDITDAEESSSDSDAE